MGIWPGGCPGVGRFILYHFGKSLATFIFRLQKNIPAWYKNKMLLRSWITKRGLSMSEFADRIGVTHAAVSRYLSGCRRPEWGILERIQKVTQGKVTPNDFRHNGKR